MEREERQDTENPGERTGVKEIDYEEALEGQRKPSHGANIHGDPIEVVTRGEEEMFRFPTPLFRFPLCGVYEPATCTCFQ